MELNCNIPIFVCWVREMYLYNLDPTKTGFIACIPFSVCSIPARAIGFQVMLDNGVVYERLPISALAQHENAPHWPVEELELWDNFGYDVCAIKYDYLAAMRCSVILKDRKWYDGLYMFTIDWYGNPIADDPGEAGHKCAHIIALNNGCYVAQPNNRIRWYEPSFITKPFPERPDYQTNNIIYSCENKGPKWHTEDSDRQMYDVIEGE